MPPSAHSDTLTAPASAVFRMVDPADTHRSSTASFGSPQRLANPAETIATRGLSCCTNAALDEVRLP